MILFKSNNILRGPSYQVFNIEVPEVFTLAIEKIRDK